MIIKFDHITFIAERKEKEAILKKLEKPLFSELSLKNLESKKKLMRNPQNDHDLYFFDAGYPTEYIFYDIVEKHGAIELKNNVIYGKYTNYNIAKKYLEGIFGDRITVNNGTIVCNMRGVLDKQDYFLVLEKTGEDNIVPYVDDGGFGVIALLMNNKYSKAPEDGICTKYESLVVNNKELELCFTRTPSVNIIFEMIKISQRGRT